jgi:cellulose synthase/poly-beta-1,6-N-acetylglucosamine synthase-like glycosyltransferase
MTVLFWILFIAFFYAYFGYAVLLFIITRFRPRSAKSELPENTEEWPEVSLFITSYNEIDILDKKVENCTTLDYPKDKLKVVFVTDGSNDGSYEYLLRYSHIKVHHEEPRKGKVNALNRGMQHTTSDIVIFTDANTHLNSDVIKLMAAHFSDPKVGCVAGRKKVENNDIASAAGAGEGLYWRFESWLKELDARFFAPVGAVGELFAIRRSLFEAVAPDTILDDMMISFNVLRKGYKLTYEPGAIASEKASFDVKEELKRKVRIAAGGIQALIRLRDLLNPFRHGRLAFQFFSHKVSRWTFAPWCFFLMYPVNAAIMFSDTEGIFWWLTFILQNFFYLLAFLGWISETSGQRFPPAFLPYYFTAINLATIKGQLRYCKGKQPAAWDKAKRML